MPTIANLYHQYVGKKAMMNVLESPEMNRNGTMIKANLGVQIPVRIVDARVNYGKEHCLVRPVRGVGSAWVWADRLRIVRDWPEEDSFENARGPHDAPAETETPVLDEQG